MLKCEPPQVVKQTRDFSSRFRPQFRIRRTAQVVKPNRHLGHPRYHVHFTPTSASSLNLVERLFAKVTERCVRRGSHTVIRSLEKAMLAYLDQRNKDPKPFSGPPMRI